MKIGIFLPNWVGDMVMATPALRALRSHFGDDAHLVGVMRPYVAEVLSGSTWLDETIFYAKRSKDPNQNFRSVVGQLQRRKLDAIVLCTQSVDGAAAAWLSGAKRRLGYARHGRGLLLTDSLAPPRDGWRLAPISLVDYLLRLTETLGCPSAGKYVELATRPQEDAQADEVWRRLGLGGPNPIVALNTGGAFGPAKNWPAEHFVALAQRLVDRNHVKVLVLCGPAEREAAQEIERQAAREHVRSLANETLSIGLTKACVRRSQLLISTDSGPRHFAAAFGVPSVAIFGPTDPSWSHNYHPREIAVRLDLDCSPCGQRICPLGHHRCLRDLMPERVLQAAQRLLAPSQPVAA